MRRFFKLLVLCIAAGTVLAVITVCQAKLCFDGAESYTFFVGDTSKNCREVHAESFIALKKFTLTDVCGESAEYSEFDFDDYLKAVNGEVIFTETLSDSVNYYCKADLPYSVNLYGNEINLHICVKKDRVKVGSPIIFGGY